MKMGKSVKIASIKTKANRSSATSDVAAFAYLTKGEVERFFSAIPATDVRSRLAFSLMYHHGLRRTELALLRREHVNHGQIWITRVKGGVSGSQRLYPMTKLYLDAYLSKRGDDGNPFLVTTRQSRGAVSPSTIYQTYRRYAESAELPAKKCHPHALRHSVAVHLMEAGLDAADVMDWLGHADISTTMIYAQITNKRREKTYLRTIKSSEIADV
jgi:integrase/recombinase XerD